MEYKCDKCYYEFPERDVQFLDHFMTVCHSCSEDLTEIIVRITVIIEGSFEVDLYKFFKKEEKERVFLAIDLYRNCVPTNYPYIPGYDFLPATLKEREIFDKIRQRLDGEQQGDIWHEILTREWRSSFQLANEYDRFQ